MKPALNLFIVTSTIATYAGAIYLGPERETINRLITSLDAPKPWVYRQLVPMLARWLDLLIPLDVAIFLLVTASGVGLFVALRKLAGEFSSGTDRTDFYLMLSVLVGLFLLGDYLTLYDLTTAFLFTLALYYLKSDQEHKYLLLFPLICLNRETAFLLTVFCFMWMKTPRDYEFIFLQVFAFVSTQLILRGNFADNPGLGVWVNPMENLEKFAADPARTLIHLSITAVILWAVLRDWGSKPAFLRLAFVTFAPALFVMYIICGQSFETRVFWELMPVASLLVIQSKKRSRYESITGQVAQNIT